MATLTTVRLNKGDSPNWGFRLQGGKDFATPLIIQKVIVGSPAERAGLVAGDSVIKVNNTDVFNLRHKDAQEVLLRAGNNFDMTIQRGGSTWKPSVIPTGNLSTHNNSINNVSPVTKTSLASRNNENVGAIGTGHNVAAKPFQSVNGAVNGGPKLVNAQYNTPIKLYSEESIAETLSAQTEVLSTGALGVNFKKNERNYDASNSEVLRILKEEESSSKSSGTPDHHPHTPPASGVDTSPLGIAGLRHVTAPETKPAPPSPQLPPGQNICADCERLIVGVFVRIKDKNLHVECFKCSTCGTSLKNVGYYNINNKLYCDIHAKLAARSNPPAPNLAPITIPPGGKIPANVISASLGNHSYPTNTLLSPTLNSSQSGAKPFGSTSPSLSPNSATLPRSSAPLSPIIQNSAHSYSPVSSSGQSAHNIVWPPIPEVSDIPTASPLYFPPPSTIKINLKSKNNDFEPNSSDNDCKNIEQTELDIMDRYHQQNMSINAQQMIDKNIINECAETISETLSRQKFVEEVIKSGPESTTPSYSNPMTEQCSSSYKNNVIQNIETDIKENLNITVEKCETHQQSKNDNVCPKKWESQMLQALTTSSEEEVKFDSVYSIPSKKTTTPLGSALAVAPSEPFNTTKISIFDPVPLPEETVPYFPPDDLFVIPLSAPETTPKRKQSNEIDKYLEDLPKPQEKLTMRSALTIAPDRPYTPVTQMVTTDQETKIQNIEEKSVKTKNIQVIKDTKETKHLNTNEETAPVLPQFDGFRCAFKNKTENFNFEVEILTSSPTQFKNKTEDSETTKSDEIQTSEMIEESCTKTENVTKIAKQKEDVVYKKPLKLSESLHKADYLPQYQMNISENAEADLRLMEKIEMAHAKHQQEKISKMENVETTHLQENIIRPIIKVEPGDNYSTENSFQPVIEDLAQNTTFSPRPRPVTPSIINKPPPIIPSYQANLVAQKYNAPTVNYLDPSSPAISRSPSPCPGALTSRKSPLLTKPSTVRPKSPAAGPPPNILTHGTPVPTKHEFKVEEAKENVAHFIPVYKEKMEHRQDIEIKGDGKHQSVVCGTGSKIQSAQISSDCQKVKDKQSESSTETNAQQCCMKENMEKFTQEVAETAQGTVTSNISEKSQVSKEEEYKQSKSTNVEYSKDGNVQIKKERRVVEEFEHINKEHETVIEKNVTTKKAFRNVNNPDFETPGIMGLHVTNPNPISSPFLKSSNKNEPIYLNKPFDTQCPIQPKQKPIETEPQCVNPSVPHFNAKQLPVPSVELPNIDATNTKDLPKPFKHGTSLPNMEFANKEPLSKPFKHVNSPSVCPKTQQLKSDIPLPNAGVGGGKQTGAVGFAPKRGRGVLNAAQLGGRIPLCAQCLSQIRGPFITALGKIWCPDHFICSTPSCRRPLQDMGFVEEQGKLYCEFCFEQYLAPLCSKCNHKIKGDCLKAIGKNFHPECFCCIHCGKLFGNCPFFLEDGNPYCEADWNEFFTTKCFACGFPVEAGDRWVEALNNNYHSQCFNCTMCKKNLEGQSFFAKGGRPYCKNHAR